MIFLLLSILCSTLIFIVFQLFKKYQLDNHSAIVINYFTAASLGLIVNDVHFTFDEIISAPWAINAVIIGSLFIIIFNVMALTTQKIGAAVSSISTKMAVVIPVVFAFIYYGDSLSFLKITGIIFALSGIYLATTKSKSKQTKEKWLLLLPIILFVGSGFLDTFLKYTQTYFLDKSGNEDKLFTSSIFFTAFLVGFIYVLFKKRSSFLQFKNFVGGAVLGLINFGSIYFLLQTLSLKNWESSVVFPLNNMGIVLLTTVSSVLFFNEQLSQKNKIGVLISLIAIFLISIG